MAIGDDFSINAAGDIRHVANTNNYRVIELHRWLQDLADDQQASAGDLIDITVFNPSSRSTDNIIELLDHSGSSGPTFNIDDDAAEYFYDGSIKQKGGDELYSGLQVLGAVNDSATQIMVVQDHDYYQFTTTPASPFWGTQSGGGYNGDAASGVLMQLMIKSRISGFDIDGGRIRLQARHMDTVAGDSYDFFNVNLGEGVAVGALGTTPDAQDDQGTTTIGGWAGGDIPTNTEGYQTIDYNNGNGATPFYSQWTYNTNSLGNKATWGYGKYITRTGTTDNIHGMDGEFFLGITHEYDYDAGGAFTEDERVVWGTNVSFDGGTSGMTEGNYVTIGSNGAAGKVLYRTGTTTGSMIIALEDTSITLLDNDTITEYNPTTGVATGETCDIAVTITDNDKGGGEGILLAATGAATGTHWIQLISGVAPVDNLPIRGITSTQTATVNLAPTLRTVPKVFLGSYTGTHIGAFGIGYDPNDVSASDSFTNLLNTGQTPPNNQQFTVFGLVSGEDRVLVAPRTGSLIDYGQMLVSTAATSGTQANLVVKTGTETAIPVDTPQDIVIRVELDNNVYKYVDCQSWTGTTFTFDGNEDFGTSNASVDNNVFVAYIDKLAAGSSESVTLKYNADRNLYVRVRDGGTVGNTPIKSYEGDAATFGSTGGSATATRTPDI